MGVAAGLSLLQSRFGALAALTHAPRSASVDPQLYRSFVVLHLVGPLFGMPICVALLALDAGSGPVALFFTAGVCLFWLLPFIARTNLDRAAFLSVQLLTSVSLFGAFFYGGLNSPFNVWLIVAVLLGLLYLPRAVLRWAGAMTAEALLFVIAYRIWPHEPRLDQTALGVLFLASSFAAALYVSLVAAFYARIKTEGSKLAQIAVRYDETASRAKAAIGRLERDNRSLSDFMAKTSHELRTSLDVVIGYSELLLEEAVEEEREADQRQLDRITASSRQMLALVSEGDRLADATPHGTSISERDERPPSPLSGISGGPRARFGRKIQIVALVLLTGLAAAPLIAVAPARSLPLVIMLVALLVALRRPISPPGQMDELTGLANRSHFLDQLERRLASPNPSEAALLLADLNGFKEVNDSLGHDVGDRLLKEVAARFAGAVPPGVLLARLDGDEFGAAAFGPEAETAIGRFAEAMLDALEEPVLADQQQLAIGVSIGIAHGRAGEIGAKELLRRSDVAMDHAKRDEREPLQAFEARMDEALKFRRTMRHDLAEALSGDQLDLHLQPVVDARTGELASAEALLRWTHPLLGPISPDKLVALAEASGQIIAIDEWVLERALDHIKRLGAVPVAINISPAHFRHPGFVRKVVGRLEAHAIPPQLLRIEITEGVLVTHTRATDRAIGELREAGIKIALDDFGTGYSSLSYLKDFGFDLLKVDRSFVKALDRGPQGAELLRAIVDLGHSLSMSVIAEGVETAEQAAAIQLLGCDFIQGYFTGRPMSIDQLEAWLAERRAASPPVAARNAASH